MRSKRRPGRVGASPQDEGFTIIEVLLAAVILAVGVSSVVSSLTWTVGRIDTSVRETAAITEAQSALDDPNFVAHIGHWSSGSFEVRTGLLPSAMSDLETAWSEVSYEDANGHRRSFRLQRAKGR